MKIFICDDHSLFREGLKALLNTRPDIEVVGDTENGFALKSTLPKIECDILITDLSMPGGGLELIRHVQDAHPKIKILILSMHAEESVVVRVLKAGAHRFLSKDAGAEALFETLRLMAQGERQVAQ